MDKSFSAVTSTSTLTTIFTTFVTAILPVAPAAQIYLPQNMSFYIDGNIWYPFFKKKY